MVINPGISKASTTSIRSDFEGQGYHQAPRLATALSGINDTYGLQQSPLLMMTLCHACNLQKDDENFDNEDMFLLKIVGMPIEV